MALDYNSKMFKFQLHSSQTRIIRFSEHLSRHNLFMRIFIFSVSLPGYQGNLQAAVSHSSTVSAWERFGVEMVLTFVVVFTYFVSTSTHRKIFGNSAAMIGAAYSACNFVSVGFTCSYFPGREISHCDDLQIEKFLKDFCAEGENIKELFCPFQSPSSSCPSCLLFVFHQQQH